MKLDNRLITHYLEFEVWDKRSAKLYLDFYLTKVDEVVNELMFEIQKKNCLFILDYSIESLNRVIDLAISEIEYVRIDLTDHDNDFLDRTNNLTLPLNLYGQSEKFGDFLFATSVYFGECIIRNAGERSIWNVLLKPKNNIDYGQPSLLNLDKNEVCNLLRIIQSTFEYFYSHNRQFDIKKSLLTLYDFNTN